MEDNRKPTKAHVFVRVRPFTEAEASVTPEDSPVPREVVVWNKCRTLTVLDAANGFTPRKNGQFEVDNVLWSFSDEENPKAVLHTQKDVYASVVTPMIPQIVEGYSTAFCVAGAASAGRLYSLYGDDVDGMNRGILPRFAEDIFNAFKKVKRENSSVSCDIQAVEVTAQETYIDLLSQKRRAAGPATAEELKLVNNPTEGPKLQGVTRMEVGKSSDALAVIRQLARVASKRSTCHVVHFHFVETYEFHDPEQLGQAVNKSRRVNVLFILLRSMPPAFQRCVDVAVEHDSGENPLAKVPTRETAFTKLYPDLLQQGYNLAFLCCVSPFYEHARETMQTLIFSTKVSKLKCKPKLLHDEALLELRNLSDEVKNLKTEMIRQTESIDIVQKEINAREVELMKQEAIHHECEIKFLETEKKIALAKRAIKIGLLRTKQQKIEQNKMMNDKKKSMAATKSEKEAFEKKADEILKSAEAINKPLKVLARSLEEQEKNNAALLEQLKEYDIKEQEIKKMQWFVTASPEEQRRYLSEDSVQHTEAMKAIAKCEEERSKHAAAKELCLQRQRAVQKAFDEVYKKEENVREKENLDTEINQLKKAIEDTEAEIRRLQMEVDKRPPGCGCTLM